MKPIFIFSLPRSGSTLLQRILATSSQISTVSEPWLLLPFIYTLKPDGIKSEYGHSLSVQAIQDFYKQFPNGRQDYLDELREFVLKLYKINSRPDSTYFLDKTPRYHLIIDEIIEIFPEGKFIFLWRNPLAVVASHVNTWCKGKWKPRVWHLDLHDGANNLLNAYSKHSSVAYELQYEKLIQSPSLEIERVCEYLMIDYSDDMLGSFRDIRLKGKWGDQTGVIKYNSLSNNSLHEWQKTYNNPIRRYWAIKYLSWLGEKKLKTMGYNYCDLVEQVSSENNINLNGMFSDLIRLAYYPSVDFLSSLNVNNKIAT